MSKRRDHEGQSRLIVAGETVIVEEDRFFGSETVNLVRDNAVRDPASAARVPGVYFLGRVGMASAPGGRDVELWRSDGMGCVPGQLTARNRDELIELLVLAFQRENPRAS